MRAYETVRTARTGLFRYFLFYNTRRPHKVPDPRTPDSVNFQSLRLAQAA